MAERRLVLDRGEQALMDRLGEATDEYEQKQRLADAARQRRDLLITKGIRAGIPWRYIGTVAHVSGVGAGLIARRTEQRLIESRAAAQASLAEPVVELCPSPPNPGGAE